MSVVQVHGSVVPPDHKDISGEEAWNRRCSLPTLAPWNPQHDKTEHNILEDTSSTRLPSVSEKQPHNDHSQSSEARFFLYSIPQWQPPATQSTDQQPSKRPTPPAPSQRTRPPSVVGQQSSELPTQPVPPQRTRPPSARLQNLPPPSLASIRQSKPPSIQPQGPQPQALHSNLGPNERIPEIYRNDMLDGTIGIRPRNKESTELQQIKSSRYSCGKKGIGLSRSMKIIIQQFMVANGYVCSHRHMQPQEKSVFRNSLLVRLDLHNTSIITMETGDEKKLIKLAWASIDGYISEQSREWRAQGVFEQIPETARPTFAAFTRGWTDRNWDGSMRDFTRATKLVTMSPMLFKSPDEPKKGSRPTDCEFVREAVIVVDDDTKVSLDTSCAGLEPTRKRSGQDGPNSHANKVARTRYYTPLTSKHEHIDHIYNEKNGLEFTRPEVKGLPIVIEAIHHAQATMLDQAPMSAKDLAVMQQDWTSHGFPSMLVETLTTGRAYTATIGKYFDNALELLALLKASENWQAGPMKNVRVDCACQNGGAAPERLRNGRVPDPSTPCNGEVEVQQSQEREDTISDRSQAGKLSERPIPSTGDVKVDRSSQLERAVPHQLENGSASGPPVAMTEKAQVDRLCAAIPDQVQNEEVDDPSGTAENPCLL